MNKIKYSIGTTDVHVTQYDPASIVDVLPPMVYTLNQNPMGGAFYLTKLTEKFTINKTYGDINKRIEKIFRAFNERNRNTGILATGDKGTGKSLLTQLSANKAIENGMPVVFISQPFHGDAFESFMSSLGNVMIVFDEFAKVYRDNDGSSMQDKVLTLFDGATTHKSDTKCLIFTVENEEWRIDELFICRTGRNFYHFKYGKISSQEVLDYCEDKGISEAAKNDIVNEIFPVSTVFGYDLLSAIVEESLRYPDTLPRDLVKDMNIQLGEEEFSYRLLEFYIDGEEQEIEKDFIVKHRCSFQLFKLISEESKYKKYRKLQIDINNKIAEKDNIIFLQYMEIKMIVQKEVTINQKLAWGKYE